MEKIRDLCKRDKKFAKVLNEKLKDKTSLLKKDGKKKTNKIGLSKKKVGANKKKMETKGQVDSRFESNKFVKINVNGVLETFEITDTEPDGNCLFRAMSICLIENQSAHENIRKVIVDYVVKN